MEQNIHIWAQLLDYVRPSRACKNIGKNVIVVCLWIYCVQCIWWLQCPPWYGNVWKNMKMYEKYRNENVWKYVSVVCLWIYCVRWAWWLQCPPIRQSAPSPPLLSNHLSPCADHSIEMLIVLRRWETILMYNDKKAITPSPLRNQISANKWLVGKSLTFSFLKIIKLLLFLPGYRHWW